MSANNYSRTAAVLSGLPAWEENEDEVDDYEGDEGEIFGGENEQDELNDDDDEENPRPVSFEEARENLDAMSDWIAFMSRKFTTREADTIYRRLNKLIKFFRPPRAPAAKQDKQQEDAGAVNIHTTTNGVVSSPQTSGAKSTSSTVPARSLTTSSSSSTAPISTTTTTTSSNTESTATIAAVEDEDWFAKWPSASGLIRANVGMLPLDAQNLVIEYDARLWFHASADVVKVCPGWVAINVDRCIWGCLDKGWLDYRLEQAGHAGGSDDQMWLKFLRMHRAFEVFPQATTEKLFGEYEDILEGGPSFACDLCPGFKDLTKKCKVCGIEKCDVCTASDLRPLHYPGCEHFNEEEELKRQAKRSQSSPQLVKEEENIDSDDEIEDEEDEDNTNLEIVENKEGKTETKESKTETKESKDQKMRDVKEDKSEEDNEGDEDEGEGTALSGGLD